jgi:ferredoxin-type protein NapH
MPIKFLPVIIGVIVGISLYGIFGWWGFLALFPWIGTAISIGIHFQQTLHNRKKLLGRKISILLILPALLLFVPLVNNENFQLEGVVLIVLVGYFSKGFVHYAVAKLFGPLIWGRGFCGWACWTAAVLDWLPIKKPNTSTISSNLKKLRYVTLAISLAIPVIAIFVLRYDVKGSYLGKAELGWMVAGTMIYYLLAIPLAFYFTDNRAFCKILCPVSLVMKFPSRFARNKKRPTANECVECGTCSNNCPMDVDVMSFIKNKRVVTDTECINCGTCRILCPVNAIR